ncbi:integrase core domain-containing protein [Rosistilla oblonga]
MSAWPVSCSAISLEARTIIEAWRQTYNHRHPHSGLDGLTPAEFAS